MSEQSYWTKKGRHQELYDRLSSKMPSLGYTENPNMNLLIAMSSVYNDVFNNGGWNISTSYRDIIRDHIKPMMPNFSPGRLARGDTAYAERQMDLALELLRGKSLDYPASLTWVNNKQGLVSAEEPADKQGWKTLVFGRESDRDEWMDRRARFLDDFDVTGDAKHPELAYKNEYRSGVEWRIGYSGEGIGAHPLHGYARERARIAHPVEVQHVEGTDLDFGKFNLYLPAGYAGTFQTFDEAVDRANAYIYRLPPEKAETYVTHELTGHEGIFHIGDESGTPSYVINAFWSDQEPGYVNVGVFEVSDGELEILSSGFLNGYLSTDDCVRDLTNEFIPLEDPDIRLIAYSGGEFDTYDEYREALEEGLLDEPVVVTPGRGADDQKETFYFSFGNSDAFPFRLGWVEVKAPDEAQAIQLFRSHYPDRNPGVVNCSFIYTDEEWRHTSMGKGEEKSQVCHRVITEYGPFEARPAREESVMTETPSYLNGQGKHQELFNQLEDRNPAIGFTDNPNMNAFRVMYELYADAELNGGRGLDESMERAFEKHVSPVIPDVSLDAFRGDDPDGRAKAMDQALAVLADKPMSFEEHPLWVHIGNSEHSFVEPTGERAADQGWSCVTFGNAEDRQAWVDERSWSRDVTAEMGQTPLHSLTKEARDRAAERNAEHSEVPKVRKPPDLGR